jgi:hypothetical protein
MAQLCSGFLSRIPMPTVSQTVTAGSMACASTMLLLKIQALAGHTSRIWAPAHFLIGVGFHVVPITGIVTVLALTQEKWPKLSRAGLGLACFPIALFLKTHMTNARLSPIIPGLLLSSWVINNAAIQIFLYQERSLLNVANLAAQGVTALCFYSL